LEIQKIPVTKIKAAKYNPRKDLKPGDAEYEKLRRSMAEFGYVEPVVWNKTSGNVVGGHQRLKILLADGAAAIDCVVVELDAAKEKALNLALNKIQGDWDQEKLALVIADLQGADFDLSLTGFDEVELYKLMGALDEVKDDDFDLTAALEEAAFVLPGDVWALGRHRLICGDATDAATVKRLMDGRKANLVLTDPPYGVSFRNTDGLTIKNDNLKNEQFYGFLLSSFSNLADSLESGGSAYIFHADTEGENFRRAFREAGFHLSGTCIWVKDSFVMGRSPYHWQHEPILYGWLKNGKHKWYAGRAEKTVWNFAKPKKNEDHPTSKPLDLLAYPIKNSSQPNGIVLDTFAGSFSTGIACEQSDRICYALELDPKYASVCVRRYVGFTKASDTATVERDGRILNYADIVKAVQKS
jgi:DNA modification methylase